MSKIIGAIELPYVQLSKKILTDIKVQRLNKLSAGLGPWLWLQLIIHAHNSLGNGELMVSENIPMTLEDIAFAAGHGYTDELVKKIMDECIRLEMILVENGVYILKNFHRYNNLDTAENVRQNGNLRSSICQYRRAGRKLPAHYREKCIKVGINPDRYEFEDDEQGPESRHEQGKQGKAEKAAKSEKAVEKKENVKPAGNFPEFWAAYPRKTGKGAAEKSFEKAIKVANFALILAALEAQKGGVLNTDPQFIPHASTWLNQKRWEDDAIIIKPTPPDGGDDNPAKYQWY